MHLLEIEMFLVNKTEKYLHVNDGQALFSLGWRILLFPPFLDNEKQKD